MDPIPSVASGLTTDPSESCSCTIGILCPGSLGLLPTLVEVETLPASLCWFFNERTSFSSWDKRDSTSCRNLDHSSQVGCRSHKGMLWRYLRPRDGCGRRDWRGEVHTINIKGLAARTFRPRTVTLRPRETSVLFPGDTGASLSLSPSPLRLFP